MLNIAYIGIGSNLGNKEDNIKNALDLLAAFPGVRVNRVASFYRTAPVGYTDQDWFVNTVAELETSLQPHELLALLLNIEKKIRPGAHHPLGSPNGGPGPAAFRR